MKFFIFVTGCQYNYYDANNIAHLMHKMGYVYDKDEKQANIIIVMACSVRQKPIDRIFGKINNWQKLPQKPKIIICGCVLPRDKKILETKVDAICDNKNFKQTVIKLTNYQNNNFCQKQFNNLTIKQFNFIPVDADKNTAFIPIMQGCNNFCTYCAVPYTRGREISRNEKDIIIEIKANLAKGKNKIILLGQNINSYKQKSTNNYQLSTNNKQINFYHSKRSEACLPARQESKESINKSNSQKSIANSCLPFSILLSKIDKISGDFTYNFLSSNPHDFTDDLIDTLSKLKKWERVLHLPLQSGDDEILHKMNRKYLTDQYLKLVKDLKFKISNLKLSTDIIVGFPGETKKQFANTVIFCKKIGFIKVFVAQYSPRPGTAAAKLYKNDVPASEKKRRWTIINNLINKVSDY